MRICLLLQIFTLISFDFDGIEKFAFGCILILKLNIKSVECNSMDFINCTCRRESLND